MSSSHIDLGVIIANFLQLICMNQLYSQGFIKLHHIISVRHYERKLLLMWQSYAHEELFLI